eukprot:403374943
MNDQSIDTDLINNSLIKEDFKPLDSSHLFNQLRFVKKSDNVTKRQQINNQTKRLTTQCQFQTRLSPNNQTGNKKRNLLNKGKIKDLYQDPVNQSESDVFKMKSRIRSNDPKYIVGKSMNEFRETKMKQQNLLTQDKSIIKDMSLELPSQPSFEKTQELNFKNQNIATLSENRQAIQSKTQYPTSRKQDCGLDKNAYLQPQLIYGSQARMNIYPNISTDRSKDFESKKVSTCILESQESYQSHQLAQVVSEKTISDVNIRVYNNKMASNQDTHSRGNNFLRLSSNNEKQSSNYISPNVWYQNMDLPYNQPSQFQMKTKIDNHQQHTRHQTSNSEQILGDQTHSQIFSQDQLAKSQMNMTAIQNPKVNPLKGNLLNSQYKSKREAEQGLNPNFDLVHYKNQAFHTFSQAMNSSKEMTLIEDKANQTFSQNQATALSPRSNLTQMNKRNLINSRSNRGDGLEKQLRQWLYGHYHIKLQNQIKIQQDLPSYMPSLRKAKQVKQNEVPNQINYETNIQQEQEFVNDSDQVLQPRILQENLQQSDQLNFLSDQQLALSLIEQRRKSTVDNKIYYPKLIDKNKSAFSPLIQQSQLSQNEQKQYNQSISSDNIRKINLEVTKENATLINFDGNLYLQNGFQIFDNQQYMMGNGGSSITPAVYANNGIGSSKQLSHNNDIISQEHNLEVADEEDNYKDQVQFKIENKKQLAINSKKYITPSAKNKDLNNQNYIQNQWLSPYQKHRMISDRMKQIVESNKEKSMITSGRGQSENTDVTSNQNINNQHYTSATYQTEDFPASLSTQDALQLKIQADSIRTIRAKCQKVNLARKTKNQIKLNIKLRSKLPQHNNEGMEASGHSEIMKYLKYQMGGPGIKVEQEDKELQMTSQSVLQLKQLNQSQLNYKDQNLRSSLSPHINKRDKVDAKDDKRFKYQEYQDGGSGLYDDEEIEEGRKIIFHQVNSNENHQTQIE